MKKQIQIYDTTLRDGMQAEGINFTVEDKIRIIEKLDAFGVHYIEAGWPGASIRDTDFFERAKTEVKLKNARLVAFGSTRKATNSAENDGVLNSLLDAETKVICLFGKTWDFHVTKALKIPLSENLKLIEDSIAYLKSKKREVIFDAEHFFDGFKNNKAYALKALKAAKKGGVDTIVLCDTNGGTLPHEIQKIVGEVRQKIKKPIGIHCHNDTGVAVANSISAVQAGAIQVQGTINGVGERCGNADLCTIVANLEIKMGYETVGAAHLKNLKELSSFVDEMANRTNNKQQPYVGHSAFAHKGGVHVDAILKDARTYEHTDPKKVGNWQRILVSDYSGMATLKKKVKEFGLKIDEDNAQVKKLLKVLKEMESRGYQYEGAEASLEVLIQKTLRNYEPHFKLLDFKITDEIDEEAGGRPTSEAVIHLGVDGHEELAVAKGVGPVHAIDQALRKALLRFYPEIAELTLLDYKVRVLPAGVGTAAFVRVLIESGDNQTRWGTVGVSENIIHASYRALVDSIDYKIMKGKK